MGPIECSVTVDTIGKECLEKQKYLYTYKGVVGVPPLAMVDDLACISVCGLETVQMNGFLNAKTNIKKLQFGEDKCHRMHIGRQNSYCPDLFIDQWKVKTITGEEDGIIDDKIDSFVGDYRMKDSDEEKYLGDLLTSDGSNTNNIKARKGKGFGIVDKISSMLEDIYFGPFHVEVSLVLRKSLLINSILLNSEVWYGVSKADVEELEVVDNCLLRRIIEAPACTPTPMLYLELGCVPIRYVIIGRRLMYLQYLLQQEEESLLYTFLMAQLENPVQGDWVEQVKNDLIDVKLDIPFEEIKLMSIENFKAKVKTAVSQAAFLYLSCEKAKLSKIMDVPHTAFKLQNYLQPMALDVQDSKLLFQLRSRMVEVKTNFRNKYSDLSCPVCKLTLDTQQHVIECPDLVLRSNIVVSNNVKYSHIFSDDIEKQTAVLQIFKQFWSERKKKSV